VGVCAVVNITQEFRPFASQVALPLGGNCYALFTILCKNSVGCEPERRILARAFERSPHLTEEFS